MTRYYVQISEENRSLAIAEAAAAAEALDGSVRPGAPGDPVGCVPVELSSEGSARGLAGRLAFSRRVLSSWPPDDLPGLRSRLSVESGSGASASFRPWGHERGGSPDPQLEALAVAWRSGGGSIDLGSPDRRFFYEARDSGPWLFLEEVASVDRRSFDARRMPKLPFQRPVSLAPRLARAAANLAGIRPGDRVIDPFVGTGALLLEAGLLGARVSGIDRDPEMVKGAIRNLAHLGVEAEELIVADAAEAAGRLGETRYDAVLTDPPYGRASGSHGEPPSELIARVLPHYAARLAPAGRLVVVLPGGPDPVGPPFERVLSIPDRVHRSLTREFRVYARHRQSDGRTALTRS